MCNHFQIFSGSSLPKLKLQVPNPPKSMTGLQIGPTLLLKILCTTCNYYLHVQCDTDNMDVPTMCAREYEPLVWTCHWKFESGLRILKNGPIHIPNFEQNTGVIHIPGGRDLARISKLPDSPSKIV